MAKLVLTDQTNTYNATSINENFTRIEQEFQNEVLYRDNPAGESNVMENALDMNSNRILNLPEPLTNNEAARLIDVQNAIGGGAANLISFTPTGGIAADNVQTALAEVDTEKVSFANLVASTGASLIKWISSLTGAVARFVSDKLSDTVSVKDFGAIGTAVPGNVTADTAAFLAAAASGKSFHVPAGTYYVSQTIVLDQGQMMYGDGCGKTTIMYTGDTVGIYMGKTGAINFVYDLVVKDLTLFCTSRDPALIGIKLENAVYFTLDNLSIFGSGSPNSGVAAERVLYGDGIHMVNNAIIGRINRVSCRLWHRGYFLTALAPTQSSWAAAVTIGGHGELANCMRGIVIGDTAIAQFTGVNVAIRDMTFQGCYTSAINVNTGDNLVIDSCYFEGNANFDITVGDDSGVSPAPIGTKIINCSMSSENIGTTPYGTFPYLYKILVNKGSFTTIRDNNISVDNVIPLIYVAAAAEYTNISGNRLNSLAASNARIFDGSTTTITADNYPEAARVSIAGFTRNLAAASGAVSYTGIGFRPTSIEFTGSVDTVNERFIGFCGLTNGGYINRCLTTDASGANTTSSDCIKLIRPTAADYVTATLASFDADGFTLNWVRTGATPGNDMLFTFIARR